MTSDADLETIALLCTRAGMIIEDGAPEAIDALPHDLSKLDLRLARLREAATDISWFIHAASGLRRQS